jgi:hypothetical protein
LPSASIAGSVTVAGEANVLALFWTLLGLFGLALDLPFDLALRAGARFAASLVDNRISFRRSVLHSMAA